MSLIIDGAVVAKKVRQLLAEEIATKKISPGLAVVLVGEDPASQVYVRNKSRAAEETGIKSWQHTLSAETTQGELLKLIHQLNNDDKVHGILVQLPLPKHFDTQGIIAAINPDKMWTGCIPSMQDV